MIFDHIDNHESYLPLHPGFAAAFDFLTAHAATAFEADEKRVVIDGERLYALKVEQLGKGRKDAKIETHDRYIDVQYTLKGCDHIGWKPRAACGGTSQGYNSQKDVEFYDTTPDLWLPTPTGHFAIFYPQDAHAPLGADSHVLKVVVKVAIEWNRNE